MLEPAMFLGLGAVAVWTYVRFPRLRPGSLLRAAVHVVLSIGAFAALPWLPGVLSPLVQHAQVRYIVLALLIFAMTYMLLSWVWLIARIMQDLLGGPRGGHPIARES